MPLPILPDPPKDQAEVERQRIRAARLAMFNALLKEALDG